MTPSIGFLDSPSTFLAPEVYSYNGQGLQLDYILNITHKIGLIISCVKESCYGIQLNRLSWLNRTFFVMCRLFNPWHMSMANYPENLISTYQLPDGINITLRPVRPEDADFIQDFFRHLSSQTKHSHFLENFRELSNDVLIRLTQIDYDREMVLIAAHTENEKETMIGMAHYAATNEPDECEVLVIVADEWHSKGIATRLMTRLMEIAKEKAVKKLIATIPAINARDLAFARSLGFVISNSDDPTLKIAAKLLS